MDTLDISRTDLLKYINTEPNPQQKLYLLVKNGFKNEATALITTAVRDLTAFFFYDWNYAGAQSQLLSRWTGRESGKRGLFVVIHQEAKLDRDLHGPDQGICFELGWEQDQLDWTPAQSSQLALAICSHALVFPLNRWTIKMALGSALAVRRLLPEDNDLRRQIEALHLVYLLRAEQFDPLQTYLEDCEVVQSNLSLEDPLHKQGLINEVIDRLGELGWTNDSIRKEFLEWLHLKTKVSPRWLLAVSQAEIFADDDIARSVAVRNWLRQHFNDLAEHLPRHNEKETLISVYIQLCQLAQCRAKEAELVEVALLNLIVDGSIEEAEWLINNLGPALGLGDDNDNTIQRIALKAGEELLTTRQHSKFIALADRLKWPVNEEYREIAQTREIPPSLP